MGPPWQAKVVGAQVHTPSGIKGAGGDRRPHDPGSMEAGPPARAEHRAAAVEGGAGPGGCGCVEGQAEGGGGDRAHQSSASCLVVGCQHAAGALRLLHAVAPRVDLLAGSWGRGRAVGWVGGWGCGAVGLWGCGEVGGWRWGERATGTARQRE